MNWGALFERASRVDTDVATIRDRLRERRARTAGEDADATETGGDR